MGDILLLPRIKDHAHTILVPPAVRGALRAVRTMSPISEGMSLWNHLLSQPPDIRESFFGILWRETVGGKPYGEAYNLRSLVPRTRAPFGKRSPASLFDEVVEELSLPGVCESRLETLCVKCHGFMSPPYAETTHEIFQCLIHLLRAHLDDGDRAYEQAHSFTGKTIGFIVREEGFSEYPHLLVQSLIGMEFPRKTG